MAPPPSSAGVLAPPEPLDPAPDPQGATPNPLDPAPGPLDPAPNPLDPTSKSAQVTAPTTATPQPSDERTLEREAFQGLPYALIVFDRDGRLAATNAEAKRLIEAMSPNGNGATELTCCELLGCRSSEGVLAGACLTELARTRDRALPEVRVDLATADGVRAMWVTAAPLATYMPGADDAHDAQDSADDDAHDNADDGAHDDDAHDVHDDAHDNDHDAHDDHDDDDHDDDDDDHGPDARARDHRAPDTNGAGNGHRDGHTILQLRPGLVQDRRRRTDPHWMSGPRLRMRVLGRTTVESPEGPIGGDWLEQRTGQLLKYLIAERHRPVHIDEIGESIWPSAEFAIAGSVRYYIHALRARLEPGRAPREPSRFIASNSGSYRLDLSHIEIDADAFETHLGAGLVALEHDDRELAACELERGLRLYRGDFLADAPYADWAMLERHRLRDLACIGLRRLADIRLQARQIDSAASSLEQLAGLQPYDESVHRQLIELDLVRGRRSDAVRRYETLRARIRRTFGHEPDFTLTDLGAPMTARRG